MPDPAPARRTAARSAVPPGDRYRGDPDAWPQARRARRRYARRPVVHRRLPDLAAVAAGLGFGAALALPLSRMGGESVAAPGGPALAAGDVAATGGTYLLLVMVLLAGRIAGLERALGQDRLLRWHRRLAPYPLLLLGAHAALTTLGYAQADRLGLLDQAGSLITGTDWIFASVVAYVMLAVIAGLSIRAVRRRLDYNAWWVMHLYTYLALAFSVPHQIFDGPTFVATAAAKAAWLALWCATAGVVAVYRIGLPVYRTLRHRLELVEVRPEGPGVYSLVLRGRAVDRLAVAGGQYFAWRFLAPGLWWHAHPLSLSALPQPPYLRVTVKVAGDATRRIARLPPGTRVAIEGSYGAFTDASRTRHKVALIGAGVGITPLRALLEDLPSHVDVVVLQRASTEPELILNDELDRLVRARRGRLLSLVGPRTRYRLDQPAHMHRLIPDLASREVYLCGPEQFCAGVAEAAKAMGIPAEAVHCETFTT